MGTDLYLPAIPAMARSFAADIQIVELSISTYMLGFAAGQLVGAPISDRMGRRPVTFAGMCLFLSATLVVIYSSSAEQLMLLRFLQGAGGGACAVNVTASVGDLYGERDAARMYSMIHMIVLTAPLIAPTIGAVLIAFFPWEAAFAFLAAYCLSVLVIAFFLVPETVQREQEKRPVVPILMEVARDYRFVLSRPLAAWFNAVTALAYGCFFVYLTDAAFIFIDYFGARTSAFPLLFGASIVTMMLFNRINLSLLRRLAPRRVIPLGHGLQLASSLLLLLYVCFATPRLAVVLPLIMLATGANAFIIGNTTARYISLFQSRRGAASAITGVIQFTVGGSLSIGISLVHDGTPRTMSLGLAVCACAAAIASARIGRIELLQQKATV